MKKNGEHSMSARVYIEDADKKQKEIVIASNYVKHHAEQMVENASSLTRTIDILATMLDKQSESMNYAVKKLAFKLGKNENAKVDLISLVDEICNERQITVAEKRIKEDFSK